jgi:hypothetical protein
LERLAIDVNHEEFVSFFRYDVCALYEGHEDEGCVFHFRHITHATPCFGLLKIVCHVLVNVLLVISFYLLCL